MKKYIYEKDLNGEIFASVNPEWDKKREKLKYDILLKYSNIPKDYWDLDFKDFEHNIVKSKDNLEKCKKYANECCNDKYHDVNIWLVGPNSSGKSTIACAIGKEFIRNNLVVKFIQAGVLIKLMLKNSGFNWEEQSQSILKEFDTCDLIIIDDAFDKNKSLTWKSSNDIIVQEWDNFFRYYLSNDVRFIVTSNAEMSELHSTYSQSLYELFDRNFYSIKFEDNIKIIRKNRFVGIL